jgi:prepilin-type processing-associated H-X9-DG protein
MIAFFQFSEEDNPKEYHQMYAGGYANMKLAEYIAGRLSIPPELIFPEERPLNFYFGLPDSPTAYKVFECPADKPIKNKNDNRFPTEFSILDYQYNAYGIYGNSYSMRERKMLGIQSREERLKIKNGGAPPATLSLNDIDVPTSLLVMGYDLSAGMSFQTIYTNNWHDRDGTAHNFLFVDGHVSFIQLELKPEEIREFGGDYYTHTGEFTYSMSWPEGVKE